MSLEAHFSPNLVESKGICVVEEWGEAKVGLDNNGLIFNPAHRGAVPAPVTQDVNQLTGEGLNVKGTV